MEASELEYVGFWARFWAFVIDSVLVLVITTPLLALLPATSEVSYGDQTLDLSQFSGGSADVLYGLVSRQVSGPSDFLVTFVLPLIAAIWFWVARAATPGKMAISAKIVDAGTGLKPSLGQAIGRYFGYFLSIIPMFLGFVWIGLDARKQGWHDKLAGTVVVRPRRRGTSEVSFADRR